MTMTMGRVGVGAGVGICLELEPEPEISKMGGSGNPAKKGYQDVFQTNYVLY